MSKESKEFELRQYSQPLGPPPAYSAPQSEPGFSEVVDAASRTAAIDHDHHMSLQQTISHADTHSQDIAIHQLPHHLAHLKQRFELMKVWRIRMQPWAGLQKRGRPKWVTVLLYFLLLPICALVIIAVAVLPSLVAGSDSTSSSNSSSSIYPFSSSMIFVSL